MIVTNANMKELTLTELNEIVYYTTEEVKGCPNIEKVASLGGDIYFLFLRALNALHRDNRCPRFTLLGIDITHDNTHIRGWFKDNAVERVATSTLHISEGGNARFNPYLFVEDEVKTQHVPMRYRVSE